MQFNNTQDGIKGNIYIYIYIVQSLKAPWDIKRNPIKIDKHVSIELC